MSASAVSADPASAAGVARSRVAIAGGGAGGLATALALAHRGIPAVIAEKSSPRAKVDRGDMLHRASVQLLERWGALETLERSGPLWIENFGVLDSRGEECFRIDLTRELKQPARLCILRHAEILGMLQAACLQTGLITILWRTKASDLLMRDGRACGILTDRGDIEADATVIATGAASPIRERHFGSQAYYEYPERTLNLLCDAIDGFRDAVHYAVGPAGNMALIPLPVEQMRISVQFRPSEGRIPVETAPALVEQRLPRLKASQVRVRSSHVYALSCSLGSNLSIPGAVLLGDAAHTTHPAGGQGMNLAFQDAEQLAAAVARGGDSFRGIDEGLRSYGRLRRRGAKRVLRRTHALGRMGGIRSRTIIRMREKAVRLANRRRAWKRALFRRMVDVG